MKGISSRQKNIYEEILYGVGIGGGIVAVLLPYLIPYFGDVVGVMTITVGNIWIFKKVLRRVLGENAGKVLRSRKLRWWMLANATHAIIILSNWEVLQSLDVVPGVYDPYDHVAFLAGYIITLLLLAGAYRVARRHPEVESSLW